MQILQWREHLALWVIWRCACNTASSFHLQTLWGSQGWYTSSLKAWSPITQNQMTFWEDLSALSPVCNFRLIMSACLLPFSWAYYENSLMLQSTSNTSTKCFLVILLHLISRQSFKRCKSWILKFVLHILCCFYRDERILISWRLVLCRRLPSQVSPAPLVNLVQWVGSKRVRQDRWHLRCEGKGVTAHHQLLPSSQA